MTATQAATKVICLRLTCLTSPALPHEQEASTFGLQDRQQHLHSGRQNADGSFLYEIEVSATQVPGATAVRFRSPYIHGTASRPFLYISLQHREKGSWLRRLKVPLPEVTWDELEQNAGQTCFTARISGSGSGTVALLDGKWIKQTA